MRKNQKISSRNFCPNKSGRKLPKRAERAMASRKRRGESGSRGGSPDDGVSNLNARRAMLLRLNPAELAEQFSRYDDVIGVLVNRCQALEARIAELTVENTHLKESREQLREEPAEGKAAAD